MFVRFLEDNRLLSDPLIAGPAGNPPAAGQGPHRRVLPGQPHPRRAGLSAAACSASWTSCRPWPSCWTAATTPCGSCGSAADGARALIDFFQKLDPESGAIVHDFTDPVHEDRGWDTRFLGDLYQDLSEAVRKRYALLQTPEFVESFILDYTLEQAEHLRPAGLRLIDPTCGLRTFC